jgi:hypothetical protein
MMTMTVTVGQHQQRSPSSGGDRGDGGSFLHFILFLCSLSCSSFAAFCFEGKNGTT